MDSNLWTGLCNECTHTSCCNNFVTPFLTPSEEKRIRKMKHENFADKFKINNKQVFALKKKQGTNECIFWNNDSGCEIYQDRPFDCKLFPFDIYKINGVYTWVVYSCSPDSNWTWSEKILKSLEEEIISEDVIKYLDEYSNLDRLDSSDKSYNLVQLRAVNLKRFKSTITK